MDRRLCDRDHAANSCSNTKNTITRFIMEQVLGFANQNLTRIVVSKACVDELNFLLAAGDRGEEGSRSSSCSSNFPYFTLSEIVPNAVSFKFCWKRSDILFCNSKNDPTTMLEAPVLIGLTHVLQQFTSAKRDSGSLFLCSFTMSLTASSRLVPEKTPPGRPGKCGM